MGRSLAKEMKGVVKCSEDVASSELRSICVHLKCLAAPAGHKKSPVAVGNGYNGLAGIGKAVEQ
jgi:hypothetical protein